MDCGGRCRVFACAMDLAHLEDLAQGLNWKHCVLAVSYAAVCEQKTEGK